MSIDIEALNEIDTIIKMLPYEDYKKIPDNFKQFIKQNKSNNYNFEVKKDIPLYKQTLKKDTKTICSLIYRKYLCSNEERIELEKEDREKIIANEKKQKENFQEKEMFKHRENMNMEQKTKDIGPKINYLEKQKWYKKILIKIVNFIKK